MTATTKKSRRLTLRDRLSRLKYEQACRLLGPEGRRWIQVGGAQTIDIEQQVSLRGGLFRLTLPDASVAIRLESGARRRLEISCSACDGRVGCEHTGAALSLILEEKLTLGLSRAPDETPPLEMMGEEELLRHVLSLREERARTERFVLRSADAKRLWTDYTITSAASGKTYRVALRGTERGVSYCSCPDFRKNTLGTCKHILHALRKLRRRFPADQFKRPYRRRHVSVVVQYGEETELRLLLPDQSVKLDAAARRAVAPLRDRPIEDPRDLVRCLRKLESLDQEVILYPDAEALLDRRLFQRQIEDLVDTVRRDPARHPLRTSLLKMELLPYQLDGIAFAVGAGRAVLADDMGLGKTIQGIGVAEMLAREAGIEKVLVICPASVKSQWCAEIARFSGRDSRLVIGGAAERAEQYHSDTFFTICNYEQVLRDILAIERVEWDLIILDEGQRIKNWQAQTSRVIKGLRSPFALVLSGTPLENRLEELYSVIEFIDDRRLGPGFRFFKRHRVVDENGKVLAYQNLAELRKKLAPILLRRTRNEVMKQLPPRTNEILRIPPTDEQLKLHNSHLQVVSTIVRKSYLTEMDLLRLRKALLMCRMCADGTFLVDKNLPGHSSKLEAIEDLIGRLEREPERKCVLFSEWTSMLDRIEPLLEARGIEYVRLDGKVPQKKRQALVHRFQRVAECRFFITTNAGSVGLNLQAADTVINVDLPWNPAVLEQRIGRAHRMGQKRPVHVFVLVTEETLEENLLKTLSVKHQLALAALDANSDLDVVELEGGIDELKRRLEVLLGAEPEAPKDETVRLDAEREVTARAQRERVAAAGGQLVTAAFSLLGELLPQQEFPPPHAANRIRQALESCLGTNEEGLPTLQLTLPDSSALDQLASILARIVPARETAAAAGKQPARQALERATS
ncbi:MAG: DEAD/DEAH box helicase [Planctomycetota bacterium]